MITVICDDPNAPRLRYVCEVIFGLILQTEYRLTDMRGGLSLPESENHAHIIYGSPTHGLGISLPSCGLLYEKGLREHHPVLHKADMLHLLFDEHEPGYSLNFDLFSAAFYLVTEYFNWIETDVDEHGRYREDTQPLYSMGFHSEPVVHQYAEWIWKTLRQRHPNLFRQVHAFDYTVSFDIDSPYLFKYKSTWLNLAGLAADVLKFRPETLARRIKTWLGAPDPYDVYDKIAQLVKPDKTLFFFLLDRHSPHDERHTWRNAGYRKLIGQLTETGAQVGIHPSYTAFTQPARIALETEKLSGIIGRSVTHARMHYLKYRLPITQRALLEAGIRNDYTACPVLQPGFKNFMALPFPWYDVAADQQTELTLHPTMLMDRTLQKYMGLNPIQGAKTLAAIVEKTRQYNGHFVLLLHNNTLSDWQEWQGWGHILDLPLATPQSRVHTADEKRAALS